MIIPSPRLDGAAHVVDELRPRAHERVAAAHDREILLGLRAAVADRGEQLRVEAGASSRSSMPRCGVPRRTVYGNLAAAVRRVQFPRRALTERFAALPSHYGVEPSFARPGEGHDKGGVESRGCGSASPARSSFCSASTAPTSTAPRSGTYMCAM